jgi:O-acetyl-ADP-ribose deacetylase (regulator of RNase III)
MSLTLLDSVSVDHLGGDSRQVMLCQGDLAALTPPDAVDYIAVSAMPGDYSPSGGSLIGALAQKGLSVQAQSQTKAADYEPTMPCWVSQDVSSAGLNFNRFILFEPSQPAASSAPGLVPTIFRALQCMTGTNAASIALPMVSTGSAGADWQTILRQMFFAAVHFASKADWPLSVVKLVVYDAGRVAAAQQAFAAMKAAYLNPPLAPQSYAVPAGLSVTPLVGDTIPAGMTQRQYNYVRAYTGNAIYMGVNAALRLNDLTASAYVYWQPTIEAISSGLAALPNYAGLTMRGTNLPPNVQSQYQPGATVTELAFTSTSRDSPWGGNTRLNITSLQGKDVEAVSYYPQEHEVLYDYGLLEYVTQVSGPSSQLVVNANQVVTNWCQS